VFLVFASLTCAEEGKSVEKTTKPTPKVTRDYLLARGYKELANRDGALAKEHAGLRTVLEDLGISRASLRPTLNQPPHSDERAADVGGLYVIVSSEVKDDQGRILLDSLDDPNAICTVLVWFQGPKREYAKTDSSPLIRIKSVAVPDDHSQPLQIEFDLSAIGKKPVAILQNDFQVYMEGGGIPPQSGFLASFPKKTPGAIVVSPGKSAVFRLSVHVAFAEWLSPGEYGARIRIGPAKQRERQRLDYEWEGEEHWSNEYKFVVK
jgi:hypothetical protein